MKAKGKKLEERSITDLIPNIYYDEKNACFAKRAGRCFDFYQINTKDLTSGNTDEIEMDCYRWAKFYRMYEEDIKFIFMKFPCNTGMQQNYWKHLLEKNKNPLFEGLLKQKLSELEYRERHTSSMEFYMMVFAKNVEKLADLRNQIDAVLQIGQFGMVSEIREEKKNKILFKLANKSSLIFQGGR